MLKAAAKRGLLMLNLLLGLWIDREGRIEPQFNERDPMIVSFTSMIDSLSEDGVVRFVDKPGGYDIPAQPEDIGETIRERFHAGKAVAITYEDSNFGIVDARPED